MGLLGYSHGSIVRWASEAFAKDFHHLPGARDVALQTHMIPRFGLTGCLEGLVVGTDEGDKGKPVEILAWLEGGDVEVGYIKTNGKKPKVVRYEVEEEVVGRMEGFVRPFCQMSRKDTGTALARFAALVRYYLLAKGSNKAIKGRTAWFEEHFPTACRDVAATQDAEALEAEIEPGKHMMNEPTTSCKLAKPATTAEINELATALPQAFRYDFEVLVDNICGTSLNYKLAPLIRAPDGAHDTSLHLDTSSAAAVTCLEEQRNEITSLRNRIQLLDHKLMVAEGRARAAEDEAANWQVHYEQEAEARRNAAGPSAIDRDGAMAM